MVEISFIEHFSTPNRFKYGFCFEHNLERHCHLFHALCLYFMHWHGVVRVLLSRVD